jgi:hypothetical protein
MINFAKSKNKILNRRAKEKLDDDTIKPISF